MKNTVRNYINRILLTFLVVFGMNIAIFTLVDNAIFKQANIDFYSIFIAVCGSFSLTIVLTFFFEINKTTLFVQTIVCYCLFLLETYALGFLKGWFSLDNLGFVLVSSILGVAGFVILVLVLIIKRNRENHQLNMYLNKFKGRDKK